MWAATMAQCTSWTEASSYSLRSRHTHSGSSTWGTSRCVIRAPRAALHTSISQAILANLCFSVLHTQERRLLVSVGSEEPGFSSTTVKIWDLPNILANRAAAGASLSGFTPPQQPVRLVKASAVSLPRTCAQAGCCSAAAASSRGKIGHHSKLTSVVSVCLHAGIQSEASRGRGHSSRSARGAAVSAGRRGARSGSSSRHHGCRERQRGRADPGCGAGNRARVCSLARPTQCWYVYQLARMHVQASQFARETSSCTESAAMVMPCVVCLTSIYTCMCV